MAILTQVPTRHVIPISGKDSLATALIQRSRRPDLPYEYLYNPTGADLPEIEEWLKQVECFLDSPIVRVGSNLIDHIYEKGILPSAHVRYCTRVSKIFPTEDYLGSDECLIYYGIRADETRPGYQPGKKTNLHPVYPLQEEGYTLSMVWEFVSSHNLLPPAFFWQEIYDLTVKRLGNLAGIIDTLAPWERIALFSWRSRPNCHLCFFQRLYEWVGLLEFHPEIFWEDEKIENEIGATNFSFTRNWPLSRIAENAQAIKLRRVKAICKALAQLMQSESLFAETEEENELDTPDLLSIVPCGLFCGK